MALIPESEAHRLQIAAGALGRKRGHQFEKDLSQAIAKTIWSEGEFNNFTPSHLVTGNPAIEIVKYIANDLNLKSIDNINAWWLGGLATSGLGDILHTEEGVPIKRSKSDVLISINSGKRQFIKGISVKTCNKNTPTNDQLYFTTASAFANLLRQNDIPFDKEAENALKMFCGDVDYRPIDIIDTNDRNADPSRWYFEELPEPGKSSIIKTLSNYQDEVTRVLLQLAYPEDPHPPEYVLHLTVKTEDINNSKLAIYTMDELILASREHAGFHFREYQIRKGRFKHDNSTHLAPRFGFVQFQRGGQKQHPTQLQFNLKAGYFNH